MKMSKVIFISSRKGTGKKENEKEEKVAQREGRHGRACLDFRWEREGGDNRKENLKVLFLYIYRERGKIIIKI